MSPTENTFLPRMALPCCAPPGFKGDRDKGEAERGLFRTLALAPDLVGIVTARSGERDSQNYRAAHYAMRSAAWGGPAPARQGAHLA